MGRDERSVFRRVETVDALGDALSDVEQAGVLAIIEIVLGKHDIPHFLSDSIQRLTQDQPGISPLAA
jgi:hypothetical protein